MYIIKRTYGTDFQNSDYLYYFDSNNDTVCSTNRVKALLLDNFEKAQVALEIAEAARSNWENGDDFKFIIEEVGA